MKYIHQTKDNCIWACIEMMTGISMNECPDLVDKGWSDTFVEFLTARGFQPYFTTIVPLGYSIALGPSGSDDKGHPANHAMIAYNGELCWDPCKRKPGLDKIEEYVILKPIEPYVIPPI